MFYLIFWDTKETSIVSDKDVKSKKKSVNSTVAVNFHGKKEQGKILAISEDKEWLENLIVTTDGEIRPSDRGVSAEGSAIRAKLRVEKKSLSSSRKKSVEDNTKKLFDLAAQIATPGTSLSANNDSHEILTSTENKSAPKTVSEFQDPGLKCHRCGLLPKASSSNVQFLDNLANFYLTHASSSQELLSEVVHVEQSDSPTAGTLNALERMRELKPGSGVFLGRDYLSCLVADYRKKPKEMLRRILKKLVGIESLKDMSALGEGKRKSVPKSIMDASIDFVQKNASKRCLCEKSELIRAVNLMCGSLRHNTSNDGEKGGIKKVNKGEKRKDQDETESTPSKKMKRDMRPESCNDIGDSNNSMDEQSSSLKASAKSGAWTVTPTKEESPAQQRMGNARRMLHLDLEKERSSSQGKKKVSLSPESSTPAQSLPTAISQTSATPQDSQILVTPQDSRTLASPQAGPTPQAFPPPVQYPSQPNPYQQPSYSMHSYQQPNQYQYPASYYPYPPPHHMYPSNPAYHPPHDFPPDNSERPESSVETYYQL